MTVASEITRIKTNIVNAYVSAKSRGATLPDVQNSENLASCIDSITGGGSGGGSDRFGLDGLVGQIDENGVLQKRTELANLYFLGVKDVAQEGMRRCFYDDTNIGSVTFPDLINISNKEACYESFYYCTNLKSASFPKLTTLSGQFAVYGMFKSCSNLTTVDLSNLTTVTGVGAMADFCSSCKNLVSVDLSKLEEVNGGNSMIGAFSGCSSLQKISFPSLTTITGNYKSPFSNGSTASYYIFYNCTALTEIHFRADAQATIESLEGYTNKWGATNATIYFDL